MECWRLKQRFVAASEYAGLERPRQHWTKIEAAELLTEKYGLPDVSDLLPKLNDMRKAENYGDIAPPGDLIAEDVAIDVETYGRTVSSLLDA
jgi:hypothetical protein